MAIGHTVIVEQSFAIKKEAFLVPVPNLVP
jgi:hypothetical protein